MRRFYVEETLQTAQELTTPPTLRRRLTRVLRFKDGEDFALFNNQDGLFSASLAGDGYRLQVKEQLAPYVPTSSLTLLIGLPKKDAMDRIIRQATELGVARIQPVLTDFCVPNRLNMARAQGLLIEAAEQCERVDLPVLMDLCPLQEAALAYPHPLYWCQERAGHPWPTSCPQPCGLLVGPEGGFSPEETVWLNTQKHVTSVTMGPTILRVDTAVAAGLGQLVSA